MTYSGKSEAGFMLMGKVTDDLTGDLIPSGTITHELMDIQSGEGLIFEDHFRDGYYAIEVYGGYNTLNQGVIFTFAADGYRSKSIEIPCGLGLNSQCLHNVSLLRTLDLEKRNEEEKKKFLSSAPDDIKTRIKLQDELESLKPERTVRRRRRRRAIKQRRREEYASRHEGQYTDPTQEDTWYGEDGGATVSVSESSADSVSTSIDSILTGESDMNEPSSPGEPTSQQVRLCPMCHNSLGPYDVKISIIPRRRTMGIHYTYTCGICNYIIGFSHGEVAPDLATHKDSWKGD
ncbi:MAG: hypothetical protein ACFFF4_02700 [Candidatus Thorarchaeota archaeon]